MLAYLGADVIKVEAIQRPDGMRMAGGMFANQGDWWERSGVTLSANTNKRGLTLNLADPKGLALCKKLIAESDVFIENFSPRVVENFGLEWDSVHAINPRTILVRMPAFGLSGPWRDNVGFAQTMEQISGLAWITGHAYDQPRIQRGPCDPLAGMHAAFATLVALAEREKTGIGHRLECTMVEGALNAAAELSIEWSAYGVELSRDGNRGPEGAPQNVYACQGKQAGKESWLALAVTNDAQWRALKDLLGQPAWAEDAELASHAGRRRKHERDRRGARALGGRARARRRRCRSCSRTAFPPPPSGTRASRAAIHSSPRETSTRPSTIRSWAATTTAARPFASRRSSIGTARPARPWASTTTKSCASSGCRQRRSKHSIATRSSGRGRKGCSLLPKCPARDAF